MQKQFRPDFSRTGYLLLWVLVIVFLYPVPLPALELSYEDAHDHAVKRARAGHHGEGANLLCRLHRQRPGYYPVTRDLVIVKTWQDQCIAALGLYEQLPSAQEKESYLLVPVSNCYWNTGFRARARDLVTDALQQKPGNTELQVQNDSLVQRSNNYPYWNLTAEASSNYSDAGNREWLLQTIFAHELAERIYVDLRYLVQRADDKEFATGNQDRAGLGFRYQPAKAFYLRQEFSRDIGESGAGGSSSEIRFRPHDYWNILLQHNTYAEDIPLRAKAIDVDAESTHLRSDFHDEHYRWTGELGVSRYEFSDTNLRKSGYLELGYAFELKPQREQRLIVGAYGSTNTLLNTVYYNPERDRENYLSYRLDLVYNSSFKRHVDSITLTGGRYAQKGHESRNTGSIRYEQNYDFTDSVSFMIALGHGNRVYDGAREKETDVELRLSWGF